jgi:uncharacterized protein (TIGR01777 family)
MTSLPSSSPVLITGASGLVGSAITPQLDAAGRPWTALRYGQAGWDAEAGQCDPHLLAGHEHILHLAGEPIAAKRWSTEQKRKIRDSRVQGTRALAEAAAQSGHVRSLICASAIGLYGDGADRILDEASPTANGFLAEVVADWEAATNPAREAGIRVVMLRLGVVLSPGGGALAKMLPPFRAGLGGPIGRGQAWMSWIHVQDAAQAFLRAMDTPEMAGAYNLVSPNPVTNLTFTRALGRALHRPTLFPVPPFLLKGLMGEMAGALTQSARVLPARLQGEGWQPDFPELDAALQDLL